MQELIRKYEQTYLKPEGDLPELKPGDTVRVSVNLYEGGSDHIAGLKKIHRIAAKGKKKEETKVERVQVYEGVVISLKGASSRRKFTVRKLSNGVGVEKTFFINSQKIKKIEVVRRAKVRRAKLYFLRDRVGKATRLKEKRTQVRKVKAVPKAQVSQPS